LKELAEFLCSEEGKALCAAREVTRDVLHDTFRSLRGFGPYAVQHVLVTMGHFGEVPVDSEVRAFVERHHGTSEVDAHIRNRYASWGKFAWWGYKMDRMLVRQNWIG